MKNISIISATGNTNFTLANNIKEILEKYKISVNLVNLENYNLPLYTANENNSNESDKKSIYAITKMLINSNGLIICAPEYNGSIPPIITNMIAWVSVSTDYWKDGFNNKKGFIATSSGGPGLKFLNVMKIQLEHLGMEVYADSISVNSKNPLDYKKAEKILKQFISII